MDSVLDSIKELVGCPVEDTSFDTELIIAINSALFGLNQLGVGSVGGIKITDSTTKWADLFGELTNMEAAKSYVGLKVRLLFDPPSTSYVISSMEKQLAEIEWRVMLQLEGETDEV